jgi:hypothetical protein
LITEAGEEQEKRRKALKDCGDKAKTTPPSTPVIGAGGPGGPKAPMGLGQLVLWFMILAVIAGGLGLGGLILLNNRPTSTPLPTATPTSVPLTPTPTVIETTPQPSATLSTPSPQASQTAPGAIIFAPFHITGDRTVNHCEHVYDVLFTIQDSNGLTTFYAGQPATYQLLDGGDVLDGVVAPDGTLSATIDEVFVREQSSCHSRLAPKMLTVGNQPVFGS